MASLPMQHGARAGQLLDDRGVVVEHLGGIRFGAPGGGLAGEAEQVLGAVGNALQRAAQAPALDVLVHLAGLADRLLAQAAAPGRCIAGRAVPDGAAKARVSSSAENSLGSQARVQLGDGGEEDVGARLRHARLRP